METTVVQNNFPKKTIVVATFFISIKNNCYTILFVAMVTELKNVS